MFALGQVDESHKVRSSESDKKEDDRYEETGKFDEKGKKKRYSGFSLLYYSFQGIEELFEGGERDAYSDSN